MRKQPRKHGKVLVKSTMQTLNANSMMNLNGMSLAEADAILAKANVGAPAELAFS